MHYRNIQGYTAQVFAILEGIQFFIKLLSLYGGLNSTLQGSKHDSNGWLGLQTVVASDLNSEVCSIILQHASTNMADSLFGILNFLFFFHLIINFFFILVYDHVFIGLLIAIFQSLFLKSASAFMHLSLGWFPVSPLWTFSFPSSERELIQWIEE